MTQLPVARAGIAEASAVPATRSLLRVTLTVMAASCKRREEISAHCDGNSMARAETEPRL